MLDVRQHLLGPFLVAAVLATVLFSGSTGQVAAAGNAEFITMTNGYRAAAKVQPVGASALLESIAIERSNAMASANRMEHDLDLIGRRLTASGVCWIGMSEIIASNRTGSISGFGEQWYGSERHRDIMLGARPTHAGGSWTRGSSGTYFAAMVFVELCGGFVDIGSSGFKAEIGWLVESKVTAGCSWNKFCPGASVTREQMASFLRRVTGIPAQASGWFTDIGSSMHRGDINGIAVAKVAAGCTDSRYCPMTEVTRGQMASFLMRTLRLPAATRDYFADDNGTMHEGAINALAGAGVTGGCSTGRFCPNSAVTREQMAGFLYRAFGP
jgi:hypothetical protein